MDRSRYRADAVGTEDRRKDLSGRTLRRPANTRFVRSGDGNMKVPPFTSGPADNRTDFCMRRKGARQLARAIEAAWADTGHEVHCRVNPIRTQDGRIVCYTVTSDLQDGLPR